MSNDEMLAQLLAKRFVQRKDAKAVQVADGGYRPIRQNWAMRDFRRHVAREQTFGHYLCDQDALTKLIVFDIDLEETGTWVELPSDEVLAAATSDQEFLSKLTVHNSRPREDWLDRRHPARAWYKYQMRVLTDSITSAVQKNLGLETCAAYSGNKGCHVYAFFGEPTDAGVARRAALMTLEYAGKLISPNGGFERHKGASFFKHAETDPYYNLGNFAVEVYPKQDSMKEKDLGNLVRLPLGKNLKNPKDPCFLIDQRVAQTVLQPHTSPIQLLQTGDPYAEDVKTDE